jgi:hypothetical protein
LHGFNGGSDPFPVQVALVMKDGSAFGGSILLKPEKQSNQYTVSLDLLQRVRAVLLPRPYPTFLPYYSQAGAADRLDISNIESVQISIGPGIPEADWDLPYTLLLSRISLE